MSWSKLITVYGDLITETWVERVISGYNEVMDATYCPSNNTSVYSSPHYSGNNGSNNGVCGGNYSGDYGKAYHVWRGAGYS